VQQVVNGRKQTQKEECEQLMNAILPLAVEMLERHGEFYPYGGAVNSAGEIVHIGAKGQTDHPPSQELIDLLMAEFRKGASAGKYRATALVMDVKTTIPSSNEKTDAIRVLLDHHQDYSVEVFFPYKLKRKQVKFEQAFGQLGKNSVFAVRK
jgi:hypothetical protein